MAQDQNEGPEEPRSRGEGGFNWRGVVLLLLALLLFGLAFLGPMSSKLDGERIPYYRFKELLAGRQIFADKDHLLVIQDSEGEKKSVIKGFYLATPADEEAPKAFSTVVNLEFVKDDLWADLYAQAAGSGSKAGIAPKVESVPPVGVEPKASGDAKGLDGVKTAKGEPLIRYLAFDTKNNWAPTLLVSFLPILFLLAILYFLFRHQVKMAGRGAMSFGKSKAKMMAMDKNKVTFKSVAGIQEAKEEVWEIVEFLRDPKKFQKLGGRIPKGVLMVGAPGTGKTLLARAIAGEADVPFFSISGSDFVEMFVGVGASRVRDMFEQGKKNAPCLIFIDEIDAVGRHRGHGLGGGHDEREHTLNALLVEMDGFDATEGVIIIAATNRPDVLDPALLRPGRFDRQIVVSLPDVKGREEILLVHAKKVKLAKDVDLSLIARGTPGYSGAELANVINEGALLAARKNQKSITQADLEEARDKVRWGRERRSLVMSEKEKLTTAYHEAGHAILVEVLEHTEPLHKVTIIPRGPSLGSTMWLPQEDKYNMRKLEVLDNLVVAMGGRVAEELHFGDVTSGASGDIKMATTSARKMVCEWGMSEAMGMIEYGEAHESVFLARDLAAGRNYSEATAQKIDAEVKRLIDEAYTKARRILLDHRQQLDAVAQALLEYETLEGHHIKDLMACGQMKDPPSSPRPPALPADVEAPTEHKPDRGNVEPDDFPGGLEGAPVGA